MENQKANGFLHQLNFKTNGVSMLISLSSLLTLLLQLCHPVTAWMPDVRPDWQIKPDKINAVFIGNKTDYYKILDQDDYTILVGARDVIYNVSISNLKEISRLEWNSSEADRELCTLKGKPDTDCHNYIRVYARLENDQILVCGTNSYKPRCRHYSPTVDELDPKVKYEIVRDVEAQGLCPYSPYHNSTYAYAEGQLYSATVADFSGSDPLIYRENLRTEQYDLKQLNQPDFVGAFERDNYVLFFFREIAMEYLNFGRTIYSRVARVCKNDRGGPYTLAKSWTSFLKARLNCSVPGDFPFYFDEIQAISPVIENGVNSLVYAVFTTSVNAIPGSAVCAFNVDDIMNAFHGPFKSQKDSSSHWLPLREDQVPKLRPGKCVEDSRMLSTIAVNFVKNHPLMEISVPAMYGRPLMTKVNLHHRLTAVAVDSHVMALNGEFYDVIYTGTDDGKITKFFNIRTPSNVSGKPDKLKTIVISETQVLPLGTPVRELVLSTKTNSLVVLTDGRVTTVDLHHCTSIRDCIGCLSLQDPNCAYDLLNKECKSLTASNNKFGTKSYLQSLNTTKKAAASLCPKSNEATPSSSATSPANIPIISINSQSLQQMNPSNDENKQIQYTEINPMDMDNSSGDDFVPTNYDDHNKINLPPVDHQLMASSIHDHSKPGKEEMNFAAFKGFELLIITTICLMVFSIGLVLGICWTKRNCQTNPLHMVAHHKQINTNGQFGLNSHKDINRLIQPNHYINHKKPNLDLEKDRSHECKNSTENLEKELPCKTSTLTKVKRTYL